MQHEYNNPEQEAPTALNSTENTNSAPFTPPIQN